MGAGSSYSIALTHSSTRTEAGRRPVALVEQAPRDAVRPGVDVEGERRQRVRRGSTKPLVPASTNVLSSVGPGIGTEVPPPSSAAEPDAVPGIAMS